MTAAKKPDGEPNIVLVVEDSRTQAEQIRYLLEQNSYVVTVAANGPEAIACMETDLPTLVITDIVMPGMNGFELCQKIKADERTRNIPVILLTSLANSEDVLEGLSCGADIFISKPYNEHYLLSNIENILVNIKLRKCERVRVGVEIQFGGKTRFITADQQQMLGMLISTYEAAVNRNKELLQAQDELEAMNERLEEMIQERTAELMKEITKRKEVEEVLQSQLKELQRWYNTMLDREDRVMELKNEVNALLKEAGKPAKYAGEPGGGESREDI